MTESGQLFTHPDEEAICFRQICDPAWVTARRISAQAFAFSSPENGHGLSVNLSSLVTAVDAFQNWIAKGRKTCGTWGVTVAQVEEAKCTMEPAPNDDDISHANIYLKESLTGLSKSAVQKKKYKAAEVLADHARKNGRYHPPADPSS